MDGASQGSDESRHERRKYIRVDIYAVTRYFCPTRDREIGIQTRLADISEGGAMLLTFDEGIPVGTEISVSFVLPGDDKAFVSVKGKVRHSGFLEENIYRSGIEFESLSSQAKKAIQKYVSSKSGK